MRRFFELCLCALVVSLVNLAAFSLLSNGAATAGPPAYSSGDVNGDGTVDVTDPVALLSYLFNSGPAPVACGAGLALTTEQAEILSHMSIEYLDDGQGNTNKTIRLSGVNLQVVNGLGATNGNPVAPQAVGDAQVNGLGNLIVGYDEGANAPKTGSHNLVVGTAHSYTSFGGATVGVGNEISAAYASVTGGNGNKASGASASVTGGAGNEATGALSVVSGGISNLASGTNAVVSGGGTNLASGANSTVSGGSSNEANGPSSTVSGGFLRTVSGPRDWTAGSLFETE